jgi:hypothetical protein
LLFDSTKLSLVGYCSDLAAEWILLALFYGEISGDNFLALFLMAGDGVKLYCD